MASKMSDDWFTRRMAGFVLALVIRYCMNDPNISHLWCLIGHLVPIGRDQVQDVSTC